MRVLVNPERKLWQKGAPTHSDDAANAAGARDAEQADSIDFTVVKSGQALKALENDWRDLEQRVPVRTMYQTFAWHWRAWTCMAEPRGRKPYVIVGRQKGRAVFIWPLAISRMGLVRVARPLNSETTENSDILLDPSVPGDEVLEAAWAGFADKAPVDMLDAWFIRDGSDMARLLQGRSRLTQMSQPAPYLVLGRYGDWETYRKGLSKKLLSDLRRRRRRLEEKGDVTFRVAETAEDADRGLEWLMIYKAERYREQNTDAPWFETEAFRAFLRGVVHDALAAGNLFLGTIELDGRILAAKLGFHINGWQDSLISTFDPEFNPSSPAKLLIEETLKWAFEQGHEVFDYRVGDESYKYDWMKEEVPGHRFQVPVSFIGRMYLGWRNHPLRRTLAWRLRTLKDKLAGWRRGHGGQVPQDEPVLAPE